MALTDQPYIPFFVDDWMNNNKLKCCSAASHGIMISIMCLMHKESDHYGKLLLKQKYKQTENQIHNFALQVARQTAFDLVDIEPALAELLEEKVLILDDDYLLCERMIRDAELSVKRSISGKKGGQKTQENVKVVASEFAQANIKANTVYENEYNKDSSIVQVDACKNRETENVRGKPIPELAIAHIRGLGEIQIKTLPTENAWELTELREMITNSEHQFQSIASTKKPMNNVLNFQAILQSFVDMIQSSGQYQTSAELRKYFTNWIGKKNGTLEKFVEELKEDKPKTKNKNSFV